MLDFGDLYLYGDGIFLVFTALSCFQLGHFVFESRVLIRFQLQYTLFFIRTGKFRAEAERYYFSFYLDFFFLTICARKRCS